MSHKKLEDKILELSVADDWFIAREEWILETIYFSKNETCACGHAPIKEVCVIRNFKNGNREIVGNSCIMKFFKINSEKIFYFLRKLKEGSSSRINNDILNFSFEHKYINEWEFNFYKDVTKIKLKSPKQSDTINKIDDKIRKSITNEFLTT